MDKKIIISRVDYDTKEILLDDSRTVERANVIINDADKGNVEWFQHQSIMIDDDNNNNIIYFDDEICPFPAGISDDIIKVIRSKQRKCIYDAGDNGFYRNNGQLSSDNYTLDDMGDVDIDEINNFTIWSVINYKINDMSIAFYLLVVGSCGRTCSACNDYQFHDCKVYVCEEVVPLINYAMTKTQRKQCREQVWFKC